MANEYAVNQADLQAVADAIREKGGTSDALSFPDGFVNAVGGIQAGTGASSLDQYIRGEITELYSEAETIASNVFASSYLLRKVSFPYAAKIPDGMFREAKYIKEVNFPSATSVGNNAFRSSPIETVYAPRVKNVVSEGFVMCSKLAYVDFWPELESIGGGGFSRCSSLQGEVTLPKLTTMSNSAFEQCSGITKLDFSVLSSSILSAAFYKCTALESVIFRHGAMLTLANTNAFSETPIASGTGYIYVPSALADAYKTATNWLVYADQIRAIEDYPDITGG